MKTRLLLAVGAALAASAAVCILPAQPAARDFHQASWGMSRAQVLSSESAHPNAITQKHGEVIVEYNSGSLAGVQGERVYILAHDQLVRAKYLFSAEHSDLNDFIADYQKVEPWLRERYGKPAREQAVWEDDSTQLERKSYLDQDRAVPSSILPSDPNVGLAVSLGQLKLYTNWETGRTRIFHTLTGQDNQITHQIEYRSIALASLEEQVRQKSDAPSH